MTDDAYTTDTLEHLRDEGFTGDERSLAEEVLRLQLLLESANHREDRLVAALRPVNERLTKIIDDEGDQCGGEYGCVCGYAAAVNETEHAAALLAEVTGPVPGTAEAEGRKCSEPEAGVEGKWRGEDLWWVWRDGREVSDRDLRNWWHNRPGDHPDRYVGETVRKMHTDAWAKQHPVTP